MVWSPWKCRITWPFGRLSYRADSHPINVAVFLIRKGQPMISCSIAVRGGQLSGALTNRRTPPTDTCVGTTFRKMFTCRRLGNEAEFTSSPASNVMTKDRTTCWRLKWLETDTNRVIHSGCGSWANDFVRDPPLMTGLLKSLVLFFTLI